MFKIVVVVGLVWLAARQWFLRRRVNTWEAVQGVRR